MTTKFSSSRRHLKFITSRFLTKLFTSHRTFGFSVAGLYVAELSLFCGRPHPEGDHRRLIDDTKALCAISVVLC